MPMPGPAGGAMFPGLAWFPVLMVENFLTKLHSTQTQIRLMIVNVSACVIVMIDVMRWLPLQVTASSGWESWSGRNGTGRGIRNLSLILEPLPTWSFWKPAQSRQKCQKKSTFPEAKILKSKGNPNRPIPSYPKKVKRCCRHCHVCRA